MDCWVSWAGEGDELLALVGDGVGGKDAVYLVVLQHGLARVGGDLRVLDLGLVAQDVAGEQLGEAGVEAAELTVLVVEQAEEQRGLHAAHAKHAGLLDGGGPGALGDDVVAGDGAVGDQVVVGVLVQGDDVVLLFIGGGAGARVDGAAGGGGVLAAAAGQAETRDDSSSAGGDEAAAAHGKFLREIAHGIILPSGY